MKLNIEVSMDSKKSKKLSAFFFMTALTVPVFGSSDPSANMSSDDENWVGINISGSTETSINQQAKEQLFVDKCMALLAKDCDRDLKDRKFVWCPNIIDSQGSFCFNSKADLSLRVTGLRRYEHFPVIFSYKNWSKNWWDDVKKFFGELGYKTEKWQALADMHLDAGEHIVYLQYDRFVDQGKILLIMPKSGSAYTGRDVGGRFSINGVASDSPAIKEIFKSTDGIEDTVFILHDAKSGRVSFGFFPSIEENFELYSILYSGYLSSDQEITSPALPWPWEQQANQPGEQISDIRDRNATTSPGIESLGAGLEGQFSEVSAAPKRRFSNEYSDSEYYSDEDYNDTEEHSQESSPELSEDERGGTSIGNNEVDSPSSANIREQQMEQLRQRYVAFRLGHLFDQDRLRFLQSEKTGEPYEPIFDIRLNAFSKTLQRKLMIGNCSLFNLSAQAKDMGSIVLASFRHQEYPVKSEEENEDIKSDQDMKNQIFDMNQILDMLSLDNQNISPIPSFSANDLQRVARQCGMNVIYLEIGDGINLKPDFFERSIVAIPEGIAPSECKSGRFGDGTVRQALMGGDATLRTIFEKMDRFYNTLILLNHKANNRLYFGFLSKETYSELLDPSENNLTETARKIDNAQWYKNTASKAASTAVGIYSFVNGVSKILNPFNTTAEYLLRWKYPKMFESTVNHNHVHTFTFDTPVGPFNAGDTSLAIPE